jgi:hypothetical protein
LVATIDADVAAHERLLLLAPRRGAEPAVIEAGFDARLGQSGMHGLGTLDRRRIDEPRAFAGRDDGHGATELVLLVGHLQHPIVQVGPVHAGVDDVEALDAELLRDVIDHRFGGRGREGQDGRAAESLDGAADLEEGRAEVMAPLRDAMRFIDDEQARALARHHGDEVRVGEALGRREDDLRLAARDGCLGGAALVGRHGAVELNRLDAELAQLVALILHQRDQRRDDKRGAGSQQGRQLIAERLAGAGGMTARVGRSAMTLSMAASCPARNCRRPKVLRRSLRSDVRQVAGEGVRPGEVARFIAAAWRGRKSWRCGGRGKGRTCAGGTA